MNLKVWYNQWAAHRLIARIEVLTMHINQLSQESSECEPEFEEPRYDAILRLRAKAAWEKYKLQEQLQKLERK